MEKIVERLASEEGKKRHNDVIGVRCCINEFQKICSFMRCSLCTRVCPPKCKCCVRSGHLLCNECFGKVKLCPFVTKLDANGSKVFCLAELEPLHLQLYDELYAALDVVLSCVYMKYGCQEMMREDDLKKHQIVCKFRPDFACMISGCNKTRLTGPMLIDHLANSHNTVVVNSNHDKLTIRFQNVPIINGHFNIWTPAVFDCYDFHFLLTVRMNPLDESMVQLRFFMLEDEGSPQNFEIHTRLMAAKNTGNSFASWTETPAKLSEMYLKFGHRESTDSHSDGFFMEMQQFLDNFIYDGQTGMQLMRMEVSIDFIGKQEE